MVLAVCNTVSCVNWWTWTRWGQTLEQSTLYFKLSPFLTCDKHFLGIPPGFSTLWWCLRCLRFGICHLLLKELEFGTPGVKIGPREHEKKIRSTGPSFAQISYLRDRDRCGPEHFFVKYWEIVNSEGTFIPEALAVLALRVQIEEILKFRAKMS